MQQYERIKSKFVDQITKLNKKEAVAEKDGTDPKKQQVIAAYRLLRNFCISFNTVSQTKKDDNRQEIPEKYMKEIETLLGNKAVFDQFKNAMKAETAEDSIKQLPNEITEDIVTALVAFIDKHDQEEIIKVLNNELTEMTTEIDKMRGDQKSRKSILNKEKVAVEKDKKEKTAKKQKKINTEDAGKTTEQRFRDLIREVQQKVSQIKLEKDDYKTYSEVQSNVDTFLDEATTDIMDIKNGLKKRFENIQAGKGDARRRNGNKRP